MPDLLWAAASGAPGALLDAALPSVPWRAQEEVLAAPDAGRGNSFAPTSESRLLEAGFSYCSAVGW